MKLDKDFLVGALPEGKFYCGETLLSFDQKWPFKQDNITVSIDSRTIQQGEFFVPLKGPQFDGHDFMGSALEKGACGALVGQKSILCLQKISPQLRQNKLFIIVPDVLEAFIALAKAWRKRLVCPVVGITGSVGKTSTKEMVKSILRSAGINAYVSCKSYNNIFGICHNLLGVPETAQACVMEVGINAVGEMLQLADILRPTIGLITKIAHAHLEGLYDLQTVAYEKRQLFAFFGDRDVGIVCGDQPLLCDVHYAHPIAKFGFKTKNQVQARKIDVLYDEYGNATTHFILKWYNQKTTINLRGNHRGFVHNSLAASAIAYFLQIPFHAVVQGLQEYTGTENRFEIKKLKSKKGLLINDAYNANPESMKVALLAFDQVTSCNYKIAILGDMLELGKKEAYWHRQIGRVINKMAPLEVLILVGDRARHIAKTAPFNLPVEFVQNWQEAQQKLEHYLQERQGQAAVLVKASNGMKLLNMVKGVIEQ